MTEDEELEVIECSICGEDIPTQEIVLVAHPDPNISGAMMVIHDRCRPPLVEGPIMGACGVCWSPMAPDGPKRHDCGGERLLWRAKGATFYAQHPALAGQATPLGRCAYPADPLNLPIYVSRIMRAFTNSHVPTVEYVRRSSEGAVTERVVPIVWRMEPDYMPPDEILPTPDRVCADCGTDRPDYKDAGIYAATCPRCGSSKAPTPR